MGNSLLEVGGRVEVIGDRVDGHRYFEMGAKGNITSVGERSYLVHFDEGNWDRSGNDSWFVAFGDCKKV